MECKGGQVLRGDTFREKTKVDNRQNGEWSANAGVKPIPKVGHSSEKCACDEDGKQWDAQATNVAASEKGEDVTEP